MNELFTTLVDLKYTDSMTNIITKVFEPINLETDFDYSDNLFRFTTEPSDFKLPIKDQIYLKRIMMSTFVYDNILSGNVPVIDVRPELNKIHFKDSTVHPIKLSYLLRPKPIKHIQDIIDNPIRTDKDVTSVILLVSNPISLKQQKVINSIKDSNIYVHLFSDVYNFIDAHPSLVIKQEIQPVVAMPIPPQQNVWAITEILPNFLYLGNVDGAADIENLKRLGIKYVLNMTSESKSSCDYDPKSFNCMRISIDDSPDVNISDYFQKAHKFIDMAKADNVGVLVHCYAGVSRSASVVISYLMKTQGWSLNKTLAYVKKLRPIVDPNIGFIACLTQYEKETASLI